ncbi:MAG: S8/S53 family peptidase, partial [Leptolyngbyaceae cyanobacterium CAN_BIN12]|nr:S8/S53 family peptidase [Leptolyngbyaceae cyanobacterium CAN_BIN12]
MLVEIKSEKSYRRLVNNPFVKSVSRSGAPESGPFFFGNGCGSQPPVSPHNIWYVGGEAIGRDIKEHGVEAAWLRAQGSGVSIGVVGTGVSKFQTQLSYDFLNGQSATRSPINRDYVWDDGDADPSHDNCGHETKLIGIMAAPRDGIGLVGIAYKSNIHSIRMDNDVSLQNGFWRAKLAIRKASTTSKIINMAFGWHELAPWDADEREDLEEEIARLYNLDYLLIGAAGTSLTVTSWMDVVFPANVFGVVAVTGIGPDGNRCPTCHAGTKVEFVAEIHQPTLHPNPDLSSSSYTLVNSGGSSHATAVISAMAAVIWSKYPGYSRDYILYRMRLAGGRSSAHPKTGWGTPNLYRAVGGIYDAELSGPSAVDAGSGLHGYTFSHQGGDG